MILEKSTWEEAKEEFKKIKLAIIPIGATESHGPHNPLGIESFIVQELAIKLDERLEVIVVPTIPVSYSRGWGEFPGTLWVKPATLKAYIKEICECLVRNGIKKIFFLNGHGPNIPIIEEISQDIACDGVSVAQIDLWRFIGSVSKDLGESKFPMGHSGEIPTSVMMAVQKDLVRINKLRPELLKETLSEKFPDIIQYYPNSLKRPYAFEGTPGKACEIKGKLILDRCLNRLEEYLKKWLIE
jgi:creatinine amidohydrolase